MIQIDNNETFQNNRIQTTSESVALNGPRAIASKNSSSFGKRLRKNFNIISYIIW